uniref:Uncharacterized protein n=1 Tax=Anguilla anguilla TaxID=7936 RepID=A0A0E9U009_ANGAN
MVSLLQLLSLLARPQLNYHLHVGLLLSSDGLSPL